jgi:putative signal transducing protein
MQPGREQLERSFADLSDAELRERLADDLTALAREVALQEAQRRGIRPAALAVDARAAAIEVASGHGPLRICARYVNPMTAQVLVACLQNAGLAARAMDSDTIYANGVLFGSLLLGGVRVMVPESQLEEALKIRAAYDAGEFAIDEDFDVGGS